MRSLALTATFAASLLAQPALAEDNAVVVELFTSQGCSACPPADEMIGELADRQDVIALALHVDYWDYIGWADTFASPAFTQRQQGYAHAVGTNLVYTPQMIVHGQDRVVGYRPMAVADLIMAHSANPDPIVIRISYASGGGFRVEADLAAAPIGDTVDVHLVSFSPHEEVDIARGENAGRHADHYNVVRSWAIVAQWDGASSFAADVTPNSDLPHAVLFQHQNNGAILGAARLD